MSEGMKAKDVVNLHRFKPYTEYKDSGVEWLGEVPEHWSVKRLRFLSLINPSKVEVNKLSPSLEVSFLPMEAIGEWGSLDLSLTKELSEVANGYTYFRENDVMIAKITPCFENGKGAIARGLANGIGFGTTELHVLRPFPEVNISFLSYVAYSRPFRKFGQVEMKGTAGQQRVPEEFVKDFSFPFPKVEEQHAIASFLDCETAKIDDLIFKKERLIELLREKRTSLITRAVSKGLDSNVPMKDSGVEWLGKIPALWKIVPLFTIAKERNLRNTRNQETNVLSLSYGRIIRRDISENFGLMPESFDTYQIVDSGNIVLRLTDLQNDKKSLRVGLVKERGIITSAYVALNMVGRITPLFGFYLLNSYDLTKVFYTLGGGVRQTMKFEDLKWMPFLMPDDGEQRAITSFLDSETAKIDALVAKIQEAIERLKEYRTALISAAVTGKIDTRMELLK